MDALAAELESHSIGSYFIYTHEAHPGERYPALRSVEQKLAHARDFRSHYGVRRRVFADSLCGDCHRYFGSMPNMTWIISRSGVVLYKADWTDVHSIRSCIDDHRAVQHRRRSERGIASPFRVERLDYRLKNKQAFLQHLREIAGPRAEEEYIAEFGSE
jgi:hypothetical protein